MGRGKNKNEGHIEEGTKEGPVVYVREKAVESDDGVDYEYYVGESGRGINHRSTYRTNGNVDKIDRGGVVYAEVASDDKFERRGRERELYDELVEQGLIVYGGS